MTMKCVRHMVLVIWIVWFLGHPATTASGVVFQTSVAQQEDEDLASACRYELTLPDPQRPVRVVWVIFDRGRDMLRHYGDPDVQAFAQRHGWALLLSFHCRAKSGSDGDMNMDPARGLVVRSSRHSRSSPRSPASPSCPRLNWSCSGSPERGPWRDG